MLDGGYIRLWRSLLDWEWYDDINTCRLFIHILITANYYENKWRGVTVGRGQRIIAYEKLASECGLTVSQVRTSLRKLERTGEILRESTNEYTLITVVNYDRFQAEKTPESQTDDKRIADESQASDTPLTDESQLIKKARKQESKKERKSTPIPPYDEFRFSAAMRERLDEWLRYKTERKEAYKPTGLHSLLKTVAREAERLGEPAVLDRITDAMASGWRGMNLDKLEAKRGTAANTKFAGLGERI